MRDSKQGYAASICVLDSWSKRRAPPEPWPLLLVLPRARRGLDVELESGMGGAHAAIPRRSRRLGRQGDVVGTIRRTLVTSLRQWSVLCKEPSTTRSKARTQSSNGAVMMLTDPFVPSSVPPSRCAHPWRCAMNAM